MTFDAGPVSATPALPPLTRSDAWLLAAVTESGRRVNLQGLIHDADWLNRLIPTFDELSYGIPRLISHGYVVVHRTRNGELRFSATPTAQKMRNSIKADSLGAVITGMAELVGARPWPEPETEDRTVGRLPSLTPADVDAAVAQHARWVERWSKPFIAVSRLVGWWVNRRVR
jgi:hypothetical protein